MVHRMCPADVNAFRGSSFVPNLVWNEWYAAYAPANTVAFRSRPLLVSSCMETISAGGLLGARPLQRGVL